LVSCTSLETVTTATVSRDGRELKLAEGYRGGMPDGAYLQRMPFQGEEHPFPYLFSLEDQIPSEPIPSDSHTWSDLICLHSRDTICETHRPIPLLVSSALEITSGLDLVA
jgi:hypothetical protein